MIDVPRPLAVASRLALMVIPLIVSSAVVAQGPGRRGGSGFADPSAVITAELAFNRLAQSDGQWTAFRKTAAPDAVLFKPRATNAQAWLRGRADPASSVLWWPSRIFMSCDGGYAVSTGGWQQADGTVGYFTTIWRREKKGSYRWILDHGDTLGALRAGREEDLEARVAQCAGGPGGGGTGWDRGRGRDEGKAQIARIPVPPPASGEGQSADGTLVWRWDVTEDGARTLVVRMRQEGAMQDVISDQVKAPGA